MHSFITDKVKSCILKAILLQLPIKIILSSLIFLNANLLYADEEIYDSHLESVSIKDLDFQYCLN